MAEINPHPALKAVVPQSPMVDGWMGDDWFHNGAFRVLSLNYAVGQATNKAEGGGEFALGGGDDYTRYLEAGSVADFAKMLGIQHYPGVASSSRTRPIPISGRCRRSTNGSRRSR
jgi:predicted acyl esterase